MSLVGIELGHGEKILNTTAIHETQFLLVVFKRDVIYAPFSSPHTSYQYGPGRNITIHDMVRGNDRDTNVL